MAKETERIYESSIRVKYQVTQLSPGRCVPVVQVTALTCRLDRRAVNGLSVYSVCTGPSEGASQPQTAAYCPAPALRKHYPAAGPPSTDLPARELKPTGRSRLRGLRSTLSVPAREMTRSHKRAMWSQCVEVSRSALGE